MKNILELRQELKTLKKAKKQIRDSIKDIKNPLEKKKSLLLLRDYEKEQASMMIKEYEKMENNIKNSLLVQKDHEKEQALMMIKQYEKFIISSGFNDDKKL